MKTKQKEGKKKHSTTESHQMTKRRGQKKKKGKNELQNRLKKKNY